jgi:hypothetical protein
MKAIRSMHEKIEIVKIINRREGVHSFEHKKAGFIPKPGHGYGLNGESVL